MRLATLSICCLLTLPAAASEPRLSDAELAGAEPKSADLGLGPGGRFRFHSDVRVNLYHFLFHWTRAEAREMRLRGRVAIAEVDRAIELPPEDDAVWRRAIDAFGPLIEMDLLHSDRTLRLKMALARGAEGRGDDPILQAIERALPVYERHWWERHDAANRAAFAEFQPLLFAYGEAIAAALAREYESVWPSDAMRVDLVAYANWAGAYASNRPNHIVFSSTAEGMQGLQGLEILFHETGHTLPLGNKVTQVPRSVAEELGVEEERLWHSIIFYVSGEAVRGALPPELAAVYIPFAEKNGLWDRGTMVAHRPALRAAWLAGSDLEERVRAAYARLAAGE